MTLWCISDLHLLHQNIIRGGKIGIRPFDTIDQMHERIIEGWNSVVKPRDKVYHLGDLTLWRPRKHYRPEDATAWATLCGVMNRLHGQKRHLLGNHDHLGIEAYHVLGFEKVMAYRHMAGFLFSHIPCHPSQFYRFKGNVHGHTHQGTIFTYDGDADRKYVNVCVDAPGMNYTPISLEQIQQRLG